MVAGVRRLGGFTIPELLIAGALGVFLSTAVIGLLGLWWQNAELVHTRLHTEQQGGSAWGVLRSAVLPAGAGLCTSKGSIASVYQPPALTHPDEFVWLAHAEIARGSKVIAHSTVTSTFTTARRGIFDVDSLVLLSDADCTHTRLAHVLARDHNSYHYRVTDGAWYSLPPRYVAEPSPEVELVYRWVMHAYALPDDGSLYRRRMGKVKDLRFNYRGEKLLDGIDEISVQYGIGDQYLSAAQMRSRNLWHKVRSLSFEWRMEDSRQLWLQHSL